MERGLLWLPLLALFIWLAWAGWNEYQKLESYRQWAEQFEHAKYDIYAVLGQNQDRLSWGKPTRRGPIEVQSFSLRDVESIQLNVDGAIADLEHPPSTGKTILLTFALSNPSASIQIPFTEVPLAVQWSQHLQADWQRLQSSV